jgi:fructokinase
MPTVISIGDCIIDAVEIGPGQTDRHPGGAALNLAVGLSRLGLCSGLARARADPGGFRLRRYLKDEGVRL